jgi:hypothetical protein
MTTSKGPWSYDAESGYVTTKDTTGAWVRGEVPGLVIAEVVSLDGISNGDLIAAAPEMRDALKDAYPYIRDDALRARIGALIAKVEGV